jgi:anthranilate phosphoribosyltransferase
MTHALLSSHHKTDRFLFFRGTEGSAQLSLDRRAPFIFQDDTHLEDGFVSPEESHFNSYDRIEANFDLSVQDSLTAGLNALAGEKGMVADTIIYNCLSILKLTGLQTTLSPDDVRQIFPKVQF